MNANDSGFPEMFSNWAGSQAQGLHEITELTGTAEHWLRGQAILAAGRGTFGSCVGVTAETGAGRTDLVLLRDGARPLRVELKLLFNNKNLLGRQNGVASVAADIEKLQRAMDDECYIAAWCLFRNWHVVPVSPAYCASTNGIALQPPAASVDFPAFAETLASTVLGQIGVHGRPQIFKAPEGRWSGLFVHSVAPAAPRP